MYKVIRMVYVTIDASYKYCIYNLNLGLNIFNKCSVVPNFNSLFFLNFKG